MARILKYQLELKDVQQFTAGTFRPIAVAKQNDTLTLWAEVSEPTTKMHMMRMNIYVVGTGHEIPNGAYYVGSAFMGAFVWHVYCKSDSGTEITGFKDHIETKKQNPGMRGGFAEEP